MASITIKLLGLDELRQRFEKEPERLNSVLHSREFLMTAGAVLANAGKKRINEGVKPPLARKTAAEKARKGFSPLPLIRSGQGRNTLGYEVSGGDLSMTLLDYMATQQFGVHKTVLVGAHSREVVSRNLMSGKKKMASGVGFVKSHNRKMNIPARPFLGILNDPEYNQLNDALVRSANQIS